MKILSKEYSKVFSHKGFDICILKIACPGNGDDLGYAIDDARFTGQTFNLLDDAVQAIEKSARVGARNGQADNI